MAQFSILTCGFLAASLLAGHALAAEGQTPAGIPAHRAFAQPSASSAGCMTRHLASHVAYQPADPTQAVACGHFLSTNTVLTVHHWDKT